MAISVVSGPHVSAPTNGANATLTFAGGLQEGDVAIVYGGHGTSQGAAVGVSTSGYTEIENFTGSAPGHWCGYKVFGPTPDSNVVCLGTGNADDACGYAAVVLRGVDPANIEDVAHTTASANSINPDPPSITTATDGCLIVVGAVSMSTDAAITVPSGYTGSGTGANETRDDASVGMAWKAQATAGTENPPSFTNWNGAAWRAITLAIRPDTGGGGGAATPTPSLLTLGVGV